MSSTSFWLQDQATCRRREVPGTIKPFAKRTLRRAARHDQNRQLPKLAHDAQIELGLVQLRAMGLDPDIVDAFALINDAIDASHYREDDRWFHDPGLFAADPEIDEFEQRLWDQEQRLWDLQGEGDDLPADVVGGMPDWALDQLPSFGGNAMHLHALFECRAPVRRTTPMYDLPDEE